jgi:MtaA/CmuA family methyltransferase
MSEEFDVRMCGITYEAYATDAAHMSRCQIEAIERYDYDWAWLQVDDCIEFEPLGVGVRGGGNILYATCGYLPPTAKTLKGLKVPDPQNDGRMPILLEAISNVKARFGESVCVTGRTAAPFSSVGLLYGIDQAMMLPYSDERLLRDTMEFLVEVQASFGAAQFEAGADAIWLGDCNASTHLMSADFYGEFAFEPAKRVIDAYRSAGGLTFYHASEDGAALPIMAELGADVLSSGAEIDIADAMESTRGKVCYIGNIDPIGVLANGTVEEVEHETERIMRIGQRNVGYVFCSGEMIPRDTPEENMLAMIGTARRLG